MLWSVVMLLQSLPMPSDAASLLAAELAHRVSASNLIADERMRLWKLKDAVLQASAVWCDALALLLPAALSLWCGCCCVVLVPSASAGVGGVGPPRGQLDSRHHHCVPAARCGRTRRRDCAAATRPDSVQRWPWMDTAASAAASPPRLATVAPGTRAHHDQRRTTRAGQQHQYGAARKWAESPVKRRPRRHHSGTVTSAARRVCTARP